ncbi:MAG: hypothetical protein LC797_07740 [Chloroflexi bacterium]|nr:hypothetical protein [Chloroflexota bacterium]
MASEPSHGSTPAHLRNAFIDLIEDDTQGEAACQLAAQLMECSDPLPVEYCEMLDLPMGSTFGHAAHRIRATLGCSGSE